MLLMPSKLVTLIYITKLIQEMQFTHVILGDRVLLNTREGLIEKIEFFRNGLHEKLEL